MSREPVCQGFLRSQSEQKAIKGALHQARKTLHQLANPLTNTIPNTTALLFSQTNTLHNITSQCNTCTLSQKDVHCNFTSSLLQFSESMCRVSCAKCLAEEGLPLPSTKSTTFSLKRRPGYMTISGQWNEEIVRTKTKCCRMRETVIEWKDSKHEGKR